MSIAAAVVQFAILGVAAVTVVALVAGSKVRNSSTNEAIRDAREWASLLSADVVGPHITPELLAGDPAAIAAMDDIVTSMVLKGPVSRMKLWTSGGTVVYSDEHYLIGRTFDLEPDLEEALRTEQPVIAFTTADEAAGALDGADGRQLEVYMPFRLDDGRLMLYEHSQHTSLVAEGAAEVTAAFSPLVLRSLIALELVQLPLAWWLARRVRAAQRQKMMLLQRALDASDDERRRIAHDLHDGVVQDLAGMSYAVDAVRHDPAIRGVPALESTLERVVDEAQKSIRGLRTLLVDIYPPSLEEGDLAGALHDLLVPLEAKGIHTEFVDSATGAMSPATHGLLYRATREALRNVEQHADATRVAVVLRDHAGDTVMLEISDDGKGFDERQLERRQDGGHFGVRLVRDLVTAADGSLWIESGPGQGTTVRLVVPR